MLNISTIVAGIVFVALAAANVVVMLEAFQPSRSATARTRLIAVHREGGYLFVSLLCIMAYGMSQRLVGLGITGHLPAHLILHIVLVLVLVPLLLLKILIARRYKHSQCVAKDTWTDDFRNLVRACVDPHVFGTSSSVRVEAPSRLTEFHV